MFLLAPLSKSKFFTRVTLVSLVKHSCHTRVAFVSHSCRSCLGCFRPFPDVYTINYIRLSCIKEYSCLKNVIHEMDSENEWFLLSASFTAKFGLFYVLTLENAFFILNSIGSFKKRY